MKFFVFACLYFTMALAQAVEKLPVTYRFEPDHSQQLLKVVFEQGGRQMGGLPVPGTYTDYLRKVTPPKDCVVTEQLSTEDYSSYYCKKGQGYVHQLVSRQLGVIAEYDNLEQFRTGDFLLDLNEEIYRVQITGRHITKRFVMKGVVSESLDGRCLLVVTKKGGKRKPRSAVCDNGRHYTYGAGKDGIVGLGPNGVSAKVMTMVDGKIIYRLMSKKGKILYQSPSGAALAQTTDRHLIFYNDMDSRHKSCVVSWNGKDVRCFKFRVTEHANTLTYFQEPNLCILDSGVCFPYEGGGGGTGPFVFVYKIKSPDQYLVCGYKAKCEKLMGFKSLDDYGKSSVIQTANGMGLYDSRHGWVYPPKNTNIEAVGDWFFVRHTDGISIYDGRRHRFIKKLSYQ